MLAAATCPLLDAVWTRTTTDRALFGAGVTPLVIRRSAQAAPHVIAVRRGAVRRGVEGNGPVVRLGGLVVFYCDGGPDSAPNVPISYDLDPSRFNGCDDVVEDSVGDVFVECAFIPV